mgnify:CR=1 FL=1
MTGAGSMTDYYAFIMTSQRDVTFDELLEWVNELRRRGKCEELDNGLYQCFSKGKDIVTDFKNIIDIALKDADEKPNEGVIWSVFIIKKEFWDRLWGLKK